MHAVIECKPGASVQVSALQDQVRQQLGALNAPKAIESVAALPRSATGKVLKRELRARYWQGWDRII